MAQNNEVAIKLRADIAQLTQGLRQAANDFDGAMQGMATSATASGNKVDAALDKIGMRRHADVAADIKKVEQAYNDLASSGELSARELEQANAKAKEQIKALMGETGNWKQSLSDMKGELIAAGAAIAGLSYMMGSSAKAASGFGTAMAEVSTLLDDTSSIDGLSESVREMARAYGGDAQSQAKALYQIISAGAGDAATATEYLNASNKLAIGGVTDITTAADGLTSILNAYGEAAGGAANVSDAMFVAMKAGKTTIGELSSSIGQVAPIASQAGVSMEELLGATAALTKGGVGTSEAMTQLRAIIAGVLKPTSEASKAAKELGLDFSVTALQSKGLAGFLEEVKVKTGGSQEAMAQLFGSVEGLGAVMSLTGNGADDFAAIMEQMGDKVGQTDQAFAKMADTPEFAAKRFQAAIGDLQISVGQAVTAMAPLLEWVTDIVNGFNELPGPVKETITVFGLAAVAVPTLVLALGSLTKALGILRSAFAIPSALGFAASMGTAATATDAASLATKGLGLAVKALPLAAAALAVAELAGALWDWHEAASAAEEATKRADIAEAALNDKLAEISRTTGVTVTTMAEFNQAVKDGRIVADEAGNGWLSAAQAQQQMEAATRAATEANKEQAANLPAGPLREQAAAIVEAATATNTWRERLAEIDPTAKDAKTKIDELLNSLNMADAADMVGLQTALNGVKATSEELGKTIEKELAERLRALDSQSLATLSASLKQAFADGAISAEQYAEQASKVVAESARRMGIDVNEAMGKVTDKTKNTLSDIASLADGLKGVGASAKEQSAVIRQALEGAFAAAKTKADVDAIKAKMAELGKQGQLTGADMTALGNAASAALQKAGGDSVTAAEQAAAAMEKITQENRELQGVGEGVQEVADNVQAIATASDSAAEAVEGTNSSFAQFFATARDGYYAMSEQMGKFYDDAVKKNHVYGKSVMDFWNGVGADMAQVTEQYHKQNDAISELMSNIDSGALSAYQLVKQGENAIGAMGLLGDEQLGPLRSAIEGARRELEAMSKAASDTLGNLQDELDQLQGNNDAIEERRQERRRADIEDQLAQAKAQGNKEAIADLEESLALAKQIEDAERRKAREAEKERKAREKEREALEQERMQQERERSNSLPAPRVTEPARPPATREPPQPVDRSSLKPSRLVQIDITCNNKKASVYAENERDLIAVLESARGTG